MGKRLKNAWELFKSAASHWTADHAQRLGAALAYYAVLALPPMLVILLFIATLFYGGSAKTGFSQQFNSLVGPNAGQFLQTLMTNPQTHSKGPLATALAIATLVFTATGFFLELQGSLNTIWGVEQRSDTGWCWTIVNRLLCFLLIVVIGALLVLSLVTSTALAAVQHAFGNRIPGGAAPWHALEFLVSFGIITVLFAAIFKFLPDVRLAWRDVWVGAALTALLFTIGKFGLGLYLGKGSVGSPYGVAGALVLVLVWIYYSAQIFFFGAEFTQAHANRFGKRICPTRHSQWRVYGQSAAEDREEAGINPQAAAPPPSAAPAKAVKSPEVPPPSPRPPVEPTHPRRAPQPEPPGHPEPAHAHEHSRRRHRRLTRFPSPDLAPPPPEPLPPDYHHALADLADRVHSWRDFRR